MKAYASRRVSRPPSHGADRPPRSRRGCRRFARTIGSSRLALRSGRKASSTTRWGRWVQAGADGRIGRNAAAAAHGSEGPSSFLESSIAGSPPSSAVDLCVHKGGRFDARRKDLSRRAQRLGQPARAAQEVFCRPGHFRLLGVDAFRRSVPLGFADRLEDTSLGHAAEIAVDRRSPADRSHVEGDGLAEAVGIGDRLRASIVGFGYGVDGQRDAMRAGPT